MGTAKSVFDLVLPPVSRRFLLDSTSTVRAYLHNASQITHCALVSTLSTCGPSMSLLADGGRRVLRTEKDEAQHLKTLG